MRAGEGSSALVEPGIKTIERAGEGATCVGALECKEAKLGTDEVEERETTFLPWFQPFGSGISCRPEGIHALRCVAMGRAQCARPSRSSSKPVSGRLSLFIEGLDGSADHSGGRPRDRGEEAKERIRRRGGISSAAASSCAEHWRTFNQPSESRAVHGFTLNPPGMPER